MRERTKGEWYAQIHEQGASIRVMIEGERETIANLNNYEDIVNLEANAAFICRAVNSHDRLVEALEKLLEIGEQIEVFPEHQRFYDEIERAKSVLAEIKK